MDTILLVLFIILVLQRLIELVIAKRNEKWLIDRGGIERGGEHYKFFIIIHSLFFVAILFESYFWQETSVPFQLGLFIVFILTQIGRIWCIQTLGRFWNTKIIILPHTALIRKGPYKFIKHPNYMIVAIELLIIPLLFGAIISAVLFPILHLILVYFVRIPIEEAALAEVQQSTK